MVNNTVYQFVASNLGIQIFLKEKEHQERVRWNKRLRVLCTLHIGVSRKFHSHFTVIFTLHLATKILQNGATFIQNLRSGFKSHMRNLGNFRRAVESPQSWNSMGCFCPKNTFLQLIQRIYLLSTTYVNIHQILQVIFGTKSPIFFKLCITLQCYER